MSDFDELRRRLHRRLRQSRRGEQESFLPAPSPPPNSDQRSDPPRSPNPAGPSHGGFLPGLPDGSQPLRDAADASFLPPRPQPRESAPKPPLALESLGGAVEETSWGPYWRLRRDAASAGRDGAGLAARVHQAHGQGTGRLKQALAVETGGLLFLDLETCGLRGAPLFLCGLARIEGDGAVTDLLLARERAEEPAVIEAARSALAEAAGLVTFNGQAFDLPLLAERAGYYRIDLRLPAVQVDLLTIARRRYCKRFGNCRLQTLEQHVCGLPRADDDIPGAEIPGVYEQFLETADARLLQPILEHNAADLLTMMELLLRMAAPG